MCLCVYIVTATAKSLGCEMLGLHIKKKQSTETFDQASGEQGTTKKYPGT